MLVVQPTKDYYTMELIPGFSSRMKAKWNFCLPELVNRNLTKQDKVLLTLRVETETSYTTTILENLTERGRLIYDEFFLFNILPDDVLCQIVLSVDSIFDLIHLRKACVTILRFTEKSEILLHLRKKFQDIIEKSGHGTGRTKGWPSSKTFLEFLYWYSDSTIDTPNCGRYHDIRDYIINRHFWKNNNNLPLLFEKYMKFSSFSDVRSIFEKLPRKEIIYLIENSRYSVIAQSLYHCNLLNVSPYISEYYLNGFFSKKSCLQGYTLNDILLILCKEHCRSNMELLLSYCNETNISHIFDDIRFIELVTNKGVFYKNTAFHVLYHWIIDPKNGQTITTRIVAIAIVTYEKCRAQTLLNKIPKNPENKKRIMQAIFVLVERNMNEAKKYESWIDKNWE